MKDENKLNTVKPTKQKYFLPECGLTVEAETIGDAIKQAKALKKGDKK